MRSAHAVTSTLALMVSAAGQPAGDKPARPNILIILADGPIRRSSQGLVCSISQFAKFSLDRLANDVEGRLTCGHIATKSVVGAYAY